MQNKRPIKIDAQLLKGIKIYCVENDITITSFVEQALLQAFEETKKVVK